ncbi:glycosyltransferase [Pilimelia columellifera]|uniref:Glycosyltransferase family 1 protein n=1 Tax=Pilimelia columellifera subsp. columellifera TaxID=706583 RepID=A0ABN3NBP2_9ACTN
MRIAMISEHASPLAVLGTIDAGGQNTHVAALAQALGARGHDVRVYTRRDAVELPERVAFAANVEVAHVPAGPARPVPKDELRPFMEPLGDWLASRWQAEGWIPDIIHAHFWMSGVAALRAADPWRLPVVQTFHALGVVKRRHQGAADTSPPERLNDERMLCQRLTGVVAQCRDEIRELRRLELAPEKVTLIPSGVDLVRFQSTGPAAPRSQRRRVIAVGRLVERKGHADLIRAMCRVPDAECVIIGGPVLAELDDDPVARELRALATQLGLADRVRLTGQIPAEQMPHWYRSADVLVCPPWYEPFGLTPLEAMACGLPVVATAVGGHTDTVAPGITGDLVPARDPDALGRTIQDLLSDGVRHRAYSRASLRRVRTRYGWDHCATRMESMYRRIAAHTLTEVTA